MARQRRNQEFGGAAWAEIARLATDLHGSGFRYIFGDSITLITGRALALRGHRVCRRFAGRAALRPWGEVAWVAMAIADQRCWVGSHRWGNGECSNSLFRQVLETRAGLTRTYRYWGASVLSHGPYQHGNRTEEGIAADVSRRAGFLSGPSNDGHGWYQGTVLYRESALMVRQACVPDGWALHPLLDFCEFFGPMAEALSAAYLAWYNSHPFRQIGLVAEQECIEQANRQRAFLRVYQQISSAAFYAWRQQNARWEGILRAWSEFGRVAGQI